MIQLKFYSAFSLAKKFHHFVEVNTHFSFIAMLPTPFGGSSAASAGPRWAERLIISLDTKAKDQFSLN